MIHKASRKQTQKRIQSFLFACICCICCFAPLWDTELSAYAADTQTNLPTPSPVATAFPNEESILPIDSPTPSTATPEPIASECPVGTPTPEPTTTPYAASTTEPMVSEMPTILVSPTPITPQPTDTDLQAETSEDMAVTTQTPFPVPEVVVEPTTEPTEAPIEINLTEIPGSTDGSTDGSDLSPSTKPDVTLPPLSDASPSTSPEIGTESICNNGKTDLILTQMVSGNMSDPNKVFRYKAHLCTQDSSEWVQLPDTVGNGYTIYNNEITFQLAHGKSVQIPAIPTDVILYVYPLDHADYDVQIEDHDGTFYLPQQTNCFHIPVTRCMQLTIHNHKVAIPDTGIRLDAAPYQFLLLFIVAGSAVWLFHKYHK